MNLRHTSLLGLAALAAFVAPAHANEKLKGIACRSVHLGFEAPNATVFYNEAVVREVAPGSYFMTVGWNNGYMGIQDQGEGRKVVIFSLWDNKKTDDRNATPEELRTKAVYNDPQVRIGRFGGEGTGGQSFFNYDWKVGDTYRFMVKSKRVDNGRTEYSGYFFIPETKTWKHLATFSAPTESTSLAHFHTFVEDFRRNRESTKFTRRAEFGPAFVLDLKGNWTPVTVAKFTGDANPVLNIDSGAAGNRFYLATGGDIENKNTKLWEKTTIPATLPRPPADIDAVLAAEPPVAKPAPAAPGKTAEKPAAPAPAPATPAPAAK